MGSLFSSVHSPVRAGGRRGEASLHCAKLDESHKLDGVCCETWSMCLRALTQLNEVKEAAVVSGIGMRMSRDGMGTTCKGLCI